MHRAAFFLLTSFALFYAMVGALRNSGDTRTIYLLAHDDLGREEVLLKDWAH